MATLPDEKMYLYAAAISADRVMADGNTFYKINVASFTDTPLLAEEHAIEIARKAFPTSDGWENHFATVLQVHDWLIMTAGWKRKP